MSIRHIWAITRKEFNHILRDHSTLVLVLFTPTLLLFLMAYALTVDIKHVPVAVLDYDRSPLSTHFIQQISAGEDLDIYTYASSMQEINSLLMQGQIKAALIINHGFASDLLSMQGLPMQVIIDGTEPQSGNFAVDQIAARAQAFTNQVLGQQLQARGISPEALQRLDLRVQTWFNPSMKPVALTLAHEREHGPLEQLMATPIGRAELMLGKMLPYILVGLASVVLIPLLAMAWFQVPFNGNFILFFGLSVIFLFSVMSMGIVVGVFMRTQAAALALSFLVIFFPGFFLTGIFFPLASMPEVMRMESLALPGTHYAIITRGVFLPGVGLDVLWPYAVMMIFLGVGFTGVAALFFRKKLG